LSIGPVEVLVIAFPGNKFKGDIIPAIGQEVEKGTIRLIDVVFLYKSAAGEVRVLELIDADGDLRTFDPIVGEITDMLSDEDFDEISAVLANDTSAAILVFEHTWATKIRDAIVAAKGELIMSERIPKEAVDAVLAAR
jgi:hypothetical protein